MKITTLASLLLLGVFSCGAEPTNDSNDDLIVDDDVELFGAPLTQGMPVSNFDEILADPDAFTLDVIKTSGIVRANCMVRGCWMEIRSSRDTDSESLTVRFLNYGFFVPLDSRGSHATMQGDVYVDHLTAAEVEHLEEEGYDVTNKQEDGSAVMLSFLASGVELRGRNKN